MKGNLIISVEPYSIAQELGLETGDVLLSINNLPVWDVFDYRFLQANAEIDLLIQKQNGEEWELSIEKDLYEDLGLEFDSGLMDDMKRCSNHCIFCFIDQMPPGMRDSLYVKDDDARLSVLQGNYVTLTNLSDDDLDRIIAYRLTPVNISVHAADMDVRFQMLKNPKAKNLLQQIQWLADGRIEMHYQVVLCKGVNDGLILDHTIEALSHFLPYGRSLSIVPVGLTDYRDGLFGLEPFSAKEKQQVLEQIEKWQQQFLNEYGMRFVYGADEFYWGDGAPVKVLPSAEDYDDFPQLENGVGMMALFLENIETGLGKYSDVAQQGLEVSIATGVLPAAFLGHECLCEKIKEKTGVTVHLYGIVNRFFGRHITVSGLITGEDLIRSLDSKPLGKRLLISENMLRQGEDVFLDDMTVSEIEKVLQVPVSICRTDGSDLLEKITGREDIYE